MKILQTGMVGVVLVSLAGCGMFAEKHIDYEAGAKQVPSLEVPPDLTQPNSVDTYKVPSSPVPSSAVAQTNADASMQVDETGTNSILIKDAFDKSWRRVGLAIERAKLAMEDKDRSKGIYFLQPIKAGGSINLPKEAIQTSYRVHVQENAATCVVTVTTAEGVSDASSKLVLDALYKNIQP